MNMSNMNVGDNSMDNLQFGTVGLVRNPPFSQQQTMESLWSQTASSPDLVWMQQSMTARSEMGVNNLPMFFWDQQPSAVTSNSLLPEDIIKEMKTEDQILAQLRASQATVSVQNMPYMNEPSVMTVPGTVKTEEEASTINATPNLRELHKLIQKDTLNPNTDVIQMFRDNEPEEDIRNNAYKSNKLEQTEEAVKSSEPVRIQQQDNKQSKQTKNEADKSVKTKENKTKNKKIKEDKKEEFTETPIREDESNKPEKKSEESSPSKSKKEEKNSKKELEKEKKEWIKEGFTIVKGPEKPTKDKRKAEEVKTEEADRKRREEEKLAVEEEKKKKQLEALKSQQDHKQQQRQTIEAMIKKAPWSAVSAQAQQSTSQEGLTLAEIQRLEREKKLEQIKEQQQMMQSIAQQQAAALAREQAEARQQSAAAAVVAADAAAAAAAAAAALVLDDFAAAPQFNHAPWGNTHNGGGFWDSPPAVQTSMPVEKVQDQPRVEQNMKIKKKNTLAIPVKKEASPVAEFDTWCTSVLASWSAKIDVPTFVGFLKDIESPYEVKDYVKCYLGETKESTDFARHFLEKRSKLLRVGMVTPSDDLCSPAVAVNPRTTSVSDYQEVKGKGKKTKKNKMLKVDARILGFSVTAAEDRINVGDIDTA